MVFASFQKVIIATNKSDVKAARDYAKFVVSTVTSRELFNTLQVCACVFVPVRVWEGVTIVLCSVQRVSNASLVLYDIAVTVFYSSHCSQSEFDFCNTNKWMPQEYTIYVL